MYFLLSEERLEMQQCVIYFGQIFQHVPNQRTPKIFTIVVNTWTFRGFNLPSNARVSTNTSKILAVSCSSSPINVVLLIQRMKVTYYRMSRWAHPFGLFCVRGWESWYNLRTIIILVNVTCFGSSFLLGMEKNTRIILIYHVLEAVLI